MKDPCIIVMRISKENKGANMKKPIFELFCLFKENSTKGGPKQKGKSQGGNLKRAF